MFDKLIDLYSPSELLFGFDESNSPKVKESVFRGFVRDACDPV